MPKYDTPYPPGRSPADPEKPKMPFLPAKKLFTVGNITSLAVLLAVRAILNLPILTIYITPQFKLITFSYVADAIAAMLFGPVAAIAFGFLGDLLGFFLQGGTGGAYFPGFALSEMLSCFIFAMFLYMHEIRVRRLIICWFLNLALVLLGLNSLWLIIIYGMPATTVFAAARLISNLVQSPIHIAILFFLLPQVRKLYGKLATGRQ